MVCGKEGCSPNLFTFYKTALLLNVKSLGVGCYWYNLSAGTFCNADDLQAILALSPSALRVMCYSCEDISGVMACDLMVPRLNLSVFFH